MSLAVIQMVSQSDVLANLAQARRLLEQAAAGGAKLAVLPENFAAMGRRDIADIGRAEALGEGPILPWLKQTARDLKLWIVAGTLPLPPVDQPTAKANACSLLVDDQGEIVARYDKLHLFDVDVADNRGRYRESDDYAYGSGVVVADTPVGRVGLTVCYDLRFPGAVQRIARRRCRVDYRTVGLYRGDRRSALGCADSRAGHRDPVLCAGGSAGRDPSGAARNLRSCGDYRPVGPRAGAAGSRRSGVVGRTR